jgi:hypothetical protein
MQRLNTCHTETRKTQGDKKEETVTVITVGYGKDAVVKSKKVWCFLHYYSMNILNYLVSSANTTFKIIFPNVLEFLTLTERYEVTTLRSKLCASVKEINHNRQDVSHVTKREKQNHESHVYSCKK